MNIFAIEPTWKRYDSGYPLKDADFFEKVVALLRETGKADNDRLQKNDDLNSEYQTLLYKINNLIKEKQYITASVCTEKGKDIPLAVIVYHFLKHRAEKSNSQWCVSIGFSSAGLLGTTSAAEWRGKYRKKNTNQSENANNPFIELLKLITERIKIDIKTLSTPDSYNTFRFVLYDQVDLGEDPGDDAGIDPNQNRRSTNIGELGWIAQNADEAHLGLNFKKLKVESINKIDIPAKSKGWGRDKDKKIVETIVSFT